MVQTRSPNSATASPFILILREKSNVANPDWPWLHMFKKGNIWKYNIYIYTYTVRVYIIVYIYTLYESILSFSEKSRGRFDVGYLSYTISYYHLELPISWAFMGARLYWSSSGSLHRTRRWNAQRPRASNLPGKYSSQRIHGQFHYWREGDMFFSLASILQLIWKILKAKTSWLVSWSCNIPFRLTHEKIPLSHHWQYKLSTPLKPQQQGYV